MPETGVPASRTRSAPAAFGRGVSLVAANPGLLLAPLALGSAMLAVCGGAGFAVAAAAGGFFASRVTELRRGPRGFADVLEDLHVRILEAPVLILAGLLALLAVLIVLTAFAAWLRAGVTGALAEADARAPEGAALGAFRHPAVFRAFVASAREQFGPFFALVNLYGLAASFLAMLLVAPAAGVVVGIANERPAVVVLSAVVLAVAVPVGIACGGALRIVYLAAGRAIAVERLEALAATARGIAQAGEIPGRAVTLYLLTLAGGMTVGLAFVLPRVVLTFVAGAVNAGTWALVAISVVFILVQTLATLAYDAAITGSFVALWPQDGAVPQAPVPETPVSEPPAP